MEIRTKHFGEMEIDESEIIEFPYGLYAFEDCRRFVVLSDSESGNPFMWLQCVDSADPCFIVMNPRECFPEYSPAISEDTLAKIKLTNPDDLRLLLIAVIYDELERSTVNMLSPILINFTGRTGMQEILDGTDEANRSYTTKFPIFDRSPEDSARGGQEGGQC